MNNSNPYQTTATQNHYSVSAHAPRSTFRWVGTGSILASACSIAFGAYGLYRESNYAATLPPGTGACGMGALAALIFIFIGGPFCAVVGGGVRRA
ncbi:MAG: hypothetical protein ACK506_13270 [Pirellula sp.]